METTDKLNLKVSTNSTFDSDDIKETITGYGENFKIIESNLTDSISNTSDLAEGEFYPLSKRFWNENPLIGKYIGWVNVREGLYAKEWQPLKSYSLDELIRAYPDNGNIYKCIENGRSMSNTPTFLTNPNVEFYDANGNGWMSQYNYEVDDVVFSTNGSVIFYCICETAGLSSLAEPDWDATSNGTTLIDGSVVWRKEKAVKWKQVDISCNFRPFGKIE